MSQERSTEEFAKQTNSCNLAVSHSANEVDYDCRAGVGLANFSKLRHNGISGYHFNCSE